MQIGRRLVQGKKGAFSKWQFCLKNRIVDGKIRNKNKKRGIQCLDMGQKIRQVKTCLIFNVYYPFPFGGIGGWGGTWPVSPPVSSMVVTCEPWLQFFVVLVWSGHTNAQNKAIKIENIVVKFKVKNWGGQPTDCTARGVRSASYTFWEERESIDCGSW